MRQFVAAVAVLFLAGTGAVPASAQSDSQPTAHARSGIAREFVPSIYVPPLSNSPFSATVTTELTHTLEEGTTQSTWNQRRIMRDGSGRVYQERASFVPKNGDRQPQVTTIEISDPSTHKRLVCQTQAKSCTARPYAGTTSEVVLPSGPLPEGRGQRTVEDLGKNVVNGIEVNGTRQTVVLNAGVTGNDRPMSIVYEYWYSPKLGINVVEKRNDPRVGTQTFTVGDITLQEPDSQYFAAPAGFAVPKARTQVSPAGSGGH